MVTKLVHLNPAHLAKLVQGTELEADIALLTQSYFSKGSIAYCLLANGEPVFAGGIVNIRQGRGAVGEVWMIPTPFFRQHLKLCYRVLRGMLLMSALQGGFKRLQATCTVLTSPTLFTHLGFTYEGTLRRYGPNGETCHIYCRLF